MFEYKKDYILDSWRDTESKVFRYKQAFLPDEYLSINKKLTQEPYPSHNYIPTFKSDPSHSTYELPQLTETEIRKMILSGELIYIKDHTMYTNVIEMKTGLCTCGAWVLEESEYKHSDYCRSYKNPIKTGGHNEK
jgi:hypothetical protein